MVNLNIREIEPRPFLLEEGGTYSSAADFVTQALPYASGDLVVLPTGRLAQLGLGRNIKREINPRRIIMFSDGLVIDDDKVNGHQVEEHFKNSGTFFTACAEVFTSGGMHILIPYRSNRLALLPQNTPG